MKECKYKHDWIEALPPPFDKEGTPDICAKCGKKRVFNRKTLRYERYENGRNSGVSTGVK